MDPFRRQCASRRRLLAVVLPGVVIALALTPVVASRASTPLAWSQLSPTTSPIALWGSAMAFDSATNQLVLFGGYDSALQHYSGDTWVWSGSAWQKPTTITQSPSPRYGASMAYDSVSQKLLLFGGNEGGYESDTWLWNGQDWEKPAVTQHPAIRQNASIAPDASGHVVLFGGADPYSQLSDTWVWTGADWTQPSLSTNPPGRTRAPMAFDPLTNQVVLFGGLDQNSNSLGDTWIWDGSSWSDANNPTPLPASPSPRRDFVMAFDPDTGGLLLFSGYDGSQILSDTWAWTSAGWASQSITPSPPGRANGAMAFNPSTDQLFLFGGVGSGGIHFNGTWVYGAPIPSTPAHVALSLSTSTVTANGSDPSVATATVTDASGNPLSGQPVTFSANDDVTFGSVTDNLDGTYTSTITASTTSGDEKITARDFDLFDTKTLHELPGPAAQISVFFDSDSLTANGSDQTSGYAYVADVNGNGRPGDTVTFSTSGDVTFGSVHGEGDGTFDVLITASTTPGDETITAHDGAVLGSAVLHEVAPPNEIPSVTTQPTNQTVVSGQTATFTAAASGYPAPTVQWYVKTTPNGNFKPITGAKSTTYSFTTTASQNGNSYQAVFTNSVGTATSSAATLTVTGAPVITLNPADQTLVSGQTTTFTALANGAPPLSVQWQRKPPGGVFGNIGGATSPSYSLQVTAGLNGFQYRAVFSNGILPNATTTAALLTVQFAPVITSQPKNQTIVSGQTATFSASANGEPPPSVQWWTKTATGPATMVPGATSPTLNVTGGTSASGNVYWAVFANSRGSVTTNKVSLKVNKASTAVAITQNPDPVAFGVPVTLTATVQPVAPGAGIPTGVVQFTRGATNLGPPVALTGGQASLTIRSLLPGLTISASYGGDPDYVASSGNISPAVTFAQTITGTVNGFVLAGAATNGTASPLLISNAHITGAVIVYPGKSVAIVNSTIDLNVQAFPGAGAIFLCGSNVPYLSINNANGLVLVGDPSDDGCAGNTIFSVALNSNTGGVELGSNTIAGDASLSGNSGLGAFPDDLGVEVEANNIKGNLACSANSPPATNDGQPNKVKGTRSGECSAPTF